MRNQNTSQRAALVIGGVRGIGRAVALRLASDGFDIFATARRRDEAVETTAELVRETGRNFTLLVMDVRDPESIRQAYLPHFGECDAPEAVVYNAGVAQDNLFAFMTPDEWDKVVDTDLNGFYRAVQPLVAAMIARRSGRVVAVSSVSGQTGQAGQVNYSAAKAGLIGAVKALAREVGRKNVLVNAVAPGFIATEMTRDIPADKVLPLIPLARTGRPEEVAGAVSFLCGPDSSYMQGQVLAVNGGLFM